MELDFIRFKDHEGKSVVVSKSSIASINEEKEKKFEKLEGLEPRSRWVWVPYIVIRMKERTDEGNLCYIVNSDLDSFLTTNGIII